MTRFAAALLQIAFLALSASGQAISSLVTAEDGAFVARDPDGSVLWHQFNVGAGPALALAAPSSSVAATAAWDPYTTLNPVPESMVIGPVFDSLGNAWVVIGDNVNLTAVQWDHTTGTWQAPHILGPAGNQAIRSVGLAVDQAGSVYITYNAGSTTGQAPYALMWAKYSPSAGWQDPALAYNSPFGVAATQPAIDSMGRLVMAFNSTSKLSSIVYNPATSSWGGLQNFDQRNETPLLPTLAANKGGTRIALVYLGRGGMKYMFFNSATGQWDSPALIPGSQFSTFSVGGTLSFYPVAVDEDGNVTLATTTYLLGFYSVSGFRYENGQWTATSLLPPSRRTTVVDNFGSIAVNTMGEVLVAAPGNAGSIGSAIRVFRYKPDQGWKTETAATYPSGRVGRCKIAWFQSDQAVVTYPGADDSDGSQNALYSNGAWAPGPHLPGTTVTFFPGMATAPNGDVLFTLSETADGDLATWLRP